MLAACTVMWRSGTSQPHTHREDLTDTVSTQTHTQRIDGATSMGMYAPLAVDTV